MPKEFNRSKRVAGLLRRELAVLLQLELKDPRLKLLSVTDVVVSKDISHAKVYISTLQESADIDVMIALLNKAAGFLRSKLAKTLDIRSIPALKFYYDHSIEHSVKMSKLINDAIADDQTG